MNRLLWAAAAVAAALLPALAQAQVTPTVKQAAAREVEFGGYVLGGAVQLFDISGNVLGTQSNPLRISCPDGTTSCLGGGGGGSVTQGTTPWVVSGAAGVALALESDTGSPGATACATDTSSCSLNQLLQRLAQRLTTINTTLNSPLQAGGTVNANAGTNLNTSLLALETGGNLASAKSDLDTLAGAVSASKFNVNISSGNPTTIQANAGTNLNTSLLALETGGNLAQLVTDSGAPGATACATDTASCNFNQLLQRLAQRLTTINTTLNAPFQAGGNIGNTSFAAQFSTNNANATPHLCGSTSTFKHITSATDTQLLAANGSNNIYICDIRFSASAALNFYLEKSSSGTCGSPTQIDILITAAANEAHLPSSAFYQGLNTGASQQLCVNTSGGNLDISVIYDQY